MNYNQALTFINKLELSGIKLGLRNIKALLKRLGNPEKGLKVIHVAGTNGKGSVCAMLSSILQSAGYKVGFYSSPHLKMINERFRINSQLIPDRDFAELVGIIKPLVKEETYFEVATALAFLYFKKYNVDFVVLETGMGGRLDATNTIKKPLLSIITLIDYEHCEYLGNTIKKIAREKGGIIKKNSIVLTGAKGDAYDVIKKISINRKSLLFKSKKYDYKTNLNGEFQKSNASLAVSASDLLRKYYQITIRDKDIINGLKKVKWPGRFEFLKKNLLVDCAHNPNGIRVIAKEVNLINKNINNIILVIGILRDKDYKLMIRELMKIKGIKKIIITKAHTDRALNPKVLAEEVKTYNMPYLIISDVKKAVNYAMEGAEKKDLIVVTGSIYVISEAY